MKKADIHEGGEYAFKRSYGKVRHVRVVETDVRVPMAAHKGSQVEFLDERPPTGWHSGPDQGQVIAVPNRDLIGPWSEHRRSVAESKIDEQYAAAVLAAENTADERLAAIWNDLMAEVAAPTTIERVTFEKGYGGWRDLKFEPETALALASYLTSEPGVAYMDRRTSEIVTIKRERDEAVKAAEEARDAAIAALDDTKEEQAA